MLLFQLQLFTFVLLFVQFLLRLVGVCVRRSDGIVSCMCVVAANTGEASRTADNAIIVFFIISSFNVIGYERDSAWHRRSGVALGKNCNEIKVPR